MKTGLFFVKKHSHGRTIHQEDEKYGCLFLNILPCFPKHLAESVGISDRNFGTFHFRHRNFPHKILTVFATKHRRLSTFFVFRTAFQGDFHPKAPHLPPAASGKRLGKRRKDVENVWNPSKMRAEHCQKKCSFFASAKKGNKRASTKDRCKSYATRMRRFRRAVRTLAERATDGTRKTGVV